MWQSALYFAGTIALGLLSLLFLAHRLGWEGGRRFASLLASFTILLAIIAPIGFPNRIPIQAALIGLTSTVLILVVFVTTKLSLATNERRQLASSTTIHEQPPVFAGFWASVQQALDLQNFASICLSVKKDDSVFCSAFLDARNESQYRRIPLSNVRITSLNDWHLLASRISKEKILQFQKSDPLTATLTLCRIPDHTLQLSSTSSLRVSATTQTSLPPISEGVARLIVIQEPHYHSDAQFNLFKGLHSLFTDNHDALTEGRTVFLCEGFPSNEQIDVSILKQRAPYPDDSLIRTVLDSFVIPGQVAFAWKNEARLEIRGVENRTLYDIAAQLWASGLSTQYHQSLWHLAVQARNKQMMDEVLKALKQFECVFLFVGGLHLEGIPGEFQNILQSDTYLNGLLELLDERLALEIRDAGCDSLKTHFQRHGVHHHYLDVFSTSEQHQEHEIQRYRSLFRHQLQGTTEEYIRNYVGGLAGTTTRPDVDAADQLVSKLQEGPNIERQIRIRYDADRPETVEQLHRFVDRVTLRYLASDSATHLNEGEYYDAIRALTSDVETIANNTGMKRENIQKIKNHLFHNEHILDRHVDHGVAAVRSRFSPDFEVANSWVRLLNGKYTDQDLQLLRHEMAELTVMRISNDSRYDRAHKRANRLFPSPIEEN